MFLRIQNIAPKMLVGKSLNMSFSCDRTAELWHSFMQRRNKIKNRVNSEYLSMQIFDGIFNPEAIAPDKRFSKWAAAEVSSYDSVPDGMQTYTINGGLYAVFLQIGGARSFMQSYNYIYKNWLPASAYALDIREHFEILGEKYKNGSNDSEEDIYIPIKARD